MNSRVCQEFPFIPKDVMAPGQGSGTFAVYLVPKDCDLIGLWRNMARVKKY